MLGGRSANAVEVSDKRLNRTVADRMKRFFGDEDWIVSCFPFSGICFRKISESVFRFADCGFAHAPGMSDFLPGI